MARQVPLAGASFDAGDIVITGWVVTPLELKDGEMVTVLLASGDAVSVSVKQRS
jgi:2-keto-4-pentenoate hydratase